MGEGYLRLAATAAGAFMLVISFAVCAISSIALQKSLAGRLGQLQQRGFFGARLAQRVLARAESHLISLQIGTFLCAVLCGVLTEALVHQSGVLSGAATSLADFGVPLPLELAIIVLLGGILVLAFVGLLVVQVGKVFALSHPEHLLCLFSPVVLLLGLLLGPIVLLYRALTSKVALACGLDRVPVEREFVVSAQELSEIVEMSSKAGALEDDERQMIQSVVAFSDTVVREIMTPRREIVSVSEHATLAQIAGRFTQDAVSRMLVTGDTLDDVRGVILAKDLMRFVATDTAATFEVKRFLRPAHFVSSGKNIGDLLQELKRQAVHFAVVLDEHGGVDGVVTIEDVIEEIVGEIFDEYDKPAEETPVKRLRGGDLLVQGSVAVADLNHEWRLNLPIGEYDTIAGFVIQQLGHIPRVGEVLPYMNLLIRVEASEPNRVTMLRIVPASQAARVSAAAGVLKPESPETFPVAPDSNQEGSEPVRRVASGLR